MGTTLLDRAREMLRTDLGKAAALAVVPLATAAAQAGVPLPCVTLDFVEIGQQYGGQFQAGVQYDIQGAPSDERVKISGQLGPVSGANPFLEDPAPDPAPESIDFLMQLSVSFNCPVPINARVRVRYNMTMNFTGGAFQIFSPNMFGFVDNGMGQSSYFDAFGDEPGFLTSGVEVSGEYVSQAITIKGGTGSCTAQFPFFWSGFAPSDSFTLVIPNDSIDVELVTGFCFGDADGNGVVNFADIGLVLANFGATYPTTGPGDADGNGTVNFADISAILANFGLTC